MTITRRDFLNGVGLAIASGLTPAAQVTAAPARYPPALSGLRGHHPGSFEDAHDLRDGKKFPLDGIPIEERYDLVIVGGGISGLAAAYFYRQIAGSQARILILDNHDDFGGHAKRNEFTIEGRLMLGYGGSESLQSPKALYSETAKHLLRNLDVRIERFETAFDSKLYPSLGLKPGVFFAREAFGRDVLVSGDPVKIIDSAPAAAASGNTAALVDQFPMTPASKAQLVKLLDQRADYLAGKTVEEKIALLKTTSYRDYLMKICGVSDEVANFFQNRTHDFHGVGCDAVAASDARDDGYPGFAGLGLPSDGPNPYRDEPYIYHFPDGNASLARLLVRALIPAAASGHSMEDIVTARFDYSMLDRPTQNVRIRLSSTCVHVHDTPNRAEVAYVTGGKLHRVAGRHAILAGFNMMIPYIMPELPEAQRQALAQNVKAPLVYTNVLIRNWRAWHNLKVAGIAAPMSYHSVVKLDYPVSLGGYQCPRDPSQPMILHLVHVPCAPGQGDARTQYRLGRVELLQTTFATFEERIRDDLDRMLGPGGFSSARDIAAITVNRWSHGYAYTASPLFDRGDWEATMEAARQRRGHVAIANSDAGWDAYAHTAIDQAARAVHELLVSDPRDR
jgi:spermidine dehydrogenase